MSHRLHGATRTSHLLMSSCVCLMDSMALWSSLRSAPFFLSRLLCLLLCPATSLANRFSPLFTKLDSNHTARPRIKGRLLLLLKLLVHKKQHYWNLNAALSPELIPRPHHKQSLSCSRPALKGDLIFPEFQSHITLQLYYWSWWHHWECMSLIWSSQAHSWAQKLHQSAAEICCLHGAANQKKASQTQ